MGWRQCFPVACTRRLLFGVHCSISYVHSSLPPTPPQAHTALRAEGPESRLSGSELLLRSHHSAWELGAYHATSTQLTIWVQGILHGRHRGFSSTLEWFWSHDMQPVPPSPCWRLFEVFRFCFLSFPTVMACDSADWAFFSRLRHWVSLINFLGTIWTDIVAWTGGFAHSSLTVLLTLLSCADSPLFSRSWCKQPSQPDLRSAGHWPH